MSPDVSAQVPAGVLEAVRAKHRAMWSSGDYPAVADQTISTLGAVLVEACGIGPGDRVLDVAAGAGNAAIPAALAGADVVASDLAPDLLDAGRRRAAERGATLHWAEADAHALPFEDGEFDVVMSCVGVMFAPFHRLAAHELLRVTRPGGTIGTIAWTPDSLVGEMFATIGPYAPPPPPGAQPPSAWGSEAHVHELFGDAVTDLRAETRTLVVDRFGSGVELRDFLKELLGPVIAAYRFVADDPERVAALDEALVALGDRHLQDDGTMAWDYLLVRATRA
ncbi:class I SAM-dependent methyltransferase [Cellulomonas sp. PhB143]|uniref:class I SAM-dependent methyltransferase n=1 Tax=Cellulomonas sp. PhB143 TaxID=2485186 RepID=UPI000F498D76|nr:class I SAM-dependent methyltransferase [Cellulomonas sp. PhB143]ROS79152.1 ubiquinone/menaquinone biosynthesis C-methylase UbiE [Cellulomonas sp. PhB143]